jgi:hypothetical protein
MKSKAMIEANAVIESPGSERCQEFEMPSKGGTSSHGRGLRERFCGLQLAGIGGSYGGPGQLTSCYRLVHETDMELKDWLPSLRALLLFWSKPSFLYLCSSLFGTGTYTLILSWNYSTLLYILQNFTDEQCWSY